MQLVESFLKAFILLLNWKIIFGILTYAMLGLGFTLLIGAIGVASERKGGGMGVGCLGSIVTPIWQTLILAFFIGAVTNIVLGGDSYGFRYAFSNLGKLWLSGLAGVMFVMILSAIPIVNMVVGEDTGLFWFSIPIVISTFSGASFLSSLGLTITFLSENFLAMIGFALMAFLVALLGRFLLVGLFALISKVIRTDFESFIPESVSLSFTSFVVAVFEFIPVFAFIGYFTLKYNDLIKTLPVKEAGEFTINYFVLVIIAFAVIGGLGWIFDFWGGKSASHKNKAIDMVDNTLPKCCPNCGKTYDDSWQVCLTCTEKLIPNVNFTKEVESDK